tara:strand:+ start:37 stop:726 length:690 start_codon:yes stop_codon:yes gene_type:complete
MKNLKTLLALLFSMSLLLVPAKAQEGFSLGLTFGSHSLDQDADEDVDSNGSVDASHARTDTFVIPGITAAYTKDMGGMYSLTVGAEYIPFKANLETAINADTDSTDKDSAIDTTVKNQVSAELSNHISLVIQPTANISDNLSVFGTLGYSMADVDVQTTMQTSTSTSYDLELEGFRYGVGFRHFVDSIFIQVEGYIAEYDTISATTSDSTKVSVDADDTVLAVTVGTSF